MKSLFLTWIGDLWNRWKQPLLWRANATVVAITNSEDFALTPDSAFEFLHTVDDAWLLSHLQIPVEMDPATAARSFEGQGLLGHEVVGCLDAHADVGVVGTLWQLHLVPELLALRLVLETIELFDTNSGHVF